MLTWAELQQAAFIGCQRRIACLKLGSSQPIPTPCQWEAVLVGAFGEMTLAKALGRYWSGTPGVPDYAGDVGSYHVRCSLLPIGKLILHPDDPDGGVFVLVVGPEPRFRIVGWIIAADGKQDRWWKRPPEVRHAAWFVPQDELHAMDTLPVLP